MFATRILISVNHTDYIARPAFKSLANSRRLLKTDCEETDCEQLDANTNYEKDNACNMRNDIALYDEEDL